MRLTKRAISGAPGACVARPAEWTEAATRPESPIRHSGCPRDLLAAGQGSDQRGGHVRFAPKSKSSIRLGRGNLASRASLVEFQNSATGPGLVFLCGSFALVDEAAEDGPTLDPLPGEIRDRVVGLGRAELAAAMRAPPVVMALVLGHTTGQASTVESYRRLAGHAIGEPGAVKLKDLTARQVHKALAELPASLPARSLRPPVLTARLTRSLAHGEQLHWQPAADRRRRSLRSRVCLARPQPCLPT